MKDLSLASVEDLSIFLKQVKSNKILVISGKNSFKNSGANNKFLHLFSNKETVYYFKKSSNPNHLELQEIINQIKLFSPDLIIAIGGGSVLDYAKVANTLYDTENLRDVIINSTYNIKKKFAKLIAIPTTAGSGAEVTSNAVIYIDKIKYSVEGDDLKPDFFFLIPEFVIKGSHKIKASAGFDAIAQAFESLISIKSNEKSKMFAVKSLKLSLKFYLDFLKSPNNDNTFAMSLAANLSGKAINISKTTAPHAVSYPFTAIYNISHGHAVSLTLNKFLRFNFLKYKNANCNFDINERYKLMFNLTNTNNINSFDNFLKNLRSNANLEYDFKKLGIDIIQDYSKIISGVNILRLKNNPIKLEKNEIKDIIINE